MAMEIHNKSFWHSYVTGVKKDAQQYLGIYTESKPAPQQVPVTERTHREASSITINNITQRNSGFFDLSSRRTTVIHNHPAPAPEREKTEEEKKQEKATQAIVVGGFVVVAAAGIFGYLSNRLAKNSKQENHTQKLHDSVQAWGSRLTPVFKDIQLLTYHRHEIYQLDVSRIRKYTLAAVGMLLGGGALVAGGITVLPWLMTAGVVTLIASTALATYTLGAHWSDDEEKRPHYQAIVGNMSEQGLADRILTRLAAYTDEMELTPA